MWKEPLATAQSSHMDDSTAASTVLYPGGLHLADFLHDQTVLAPQPDNL